jgi:transposase-like protein
LIEASFIGMRSVSRIARAFGINNRNTIYAHAHASNLFELRAR